MSALIAIALLATPVPKMFFSEGPFEFIGQSTPGTYEENVDYANTPGSYEWYAETDSVFVPTMWHLWRNGVAITDESGEILEVESVFDIPYPETVDNYGNPCPEWCRSIDLGAMHVYYAQFVPESEVDPVLPRNLGDNLEERDDVWLRGLRGATFRVRGSQSRLELAAG